jgi:hypothetical protein
MDAPSSACTRWTAGRQKGTACGPFARMTELHDTTRLERHTDHVIPMATSVQWHGTRAEALDLLQALSRHCSCVVNNLGLRLATCPAHAMLFSDQRAIDGLLFSRHIARRLRNEEFQPAEVEVGTSS